MALVRSTTVECDDAIRENVKFYRKRIILAKKMKRLLLTRFYLIRTIQDTRIRPSLHANITKLELGLMEAQNSYLKLIMERQISNIAVQKSIQSTLLYMGNKNFFSHPCLNFIENSVAEQMKRMLDSSRILRYLKETTDRQNMEIKNRREQLISRFNEHVEKLENTAQFSFNDPDIMNKLQKKMRNINLLSSLMSAMVANNAANYPRVPENAAINAKITEFILMVRKWRTRRTFDYYKKKCSHC